MQQKSGWPGPEKVGEINIVNGGDWGEYGCELRHGAGDS
jgi:hypothetical protein